MPALQASPTPGLWGGNASCSFLVRPVPTQLTHSVKPLYASKQARTHMHEQTNAQTRALARARTPATPSKDSVICSQSLTAFTSDQNYQLQANEIA